MTPQSIEAENNNNHFAAKSAYDPVPGGVT